MTAKEQRELEIEASTSRARSQWNVEDIRTMSQSNLAALKAMLGHGEEFGTWFTPENWLPTASGTERNADLAALIVHCLPPRHRRLFRPEPKSPRSRGGQGRRVVSLADAQARGPARQLLDVAVEQVVRLLVLARMGPAGFGKKGAGRELDPTTVSKMAVVHIPRLVAMGLTRRLDSPSGLDLSDRRFFAHVKPEDYKKLPGSNGHRLETEVKRLHVLADKGLWTDVVPTKPQIGKTTPVAGPKKPKAEPRVVDPHKPLPDEYVSAMGLHSQWIIRELEPAAMKVAQQVEDLWLRTERHGASDEAIAQVREDALVQILCDAKWLDSRGRPIRGLPFSERKKAAASRWPVRTFKQLIYIFKLIQCAHLFVIGLSMTGRHTELTTLLRSCMVPSSNGMPYANGRTWKLVDQHDGEIREWVLPDLAMTAIERQAQLVSICERIGRRSTRTSKVKAGTHLFAQIGISAADARKRMSHANGPLQWFAAALGLEERPGGQKIRVHRFRKTIARLGALTITQAPKVLMHVFGHRDIEATLYYILEDKELQAEMDTVAREMRVMMAMEAVETIWKAEEAANAASYGGPAAAMLGRAVEVESKAAHQRGEQFGAKGLRRLAEVVALRGKTFQIVREGVMCTKYPGEAGLCNNSRGDPEYSRCQGQCKHRLEHPLARHDAEASIAQCEREYKFARGKKNVFMQEYWAKQVVVHLPRFADIKAKWSRNKNIKEMQALVAELEKAA